MAKATLFGFPTVDRDEPKPKGRHWEVGEALPHETVTAIFGTPAPAKPDCKWNSKWTGEPGDTDNG